MIKFWAPAKAKDIENSGKFRLSKFPEYRKGLTIRFYGGRAKSFNLILDKPSTNAKAAILNNLGIDVGDVALLKNQSAPLTEGFSGIFNGVNFSKISAKRQADGGGFIFVLAEVAD